MPMRITTVETAIGKSLSAWHRRAQAPFRSRRGLHLAPLILLHRRLPKRMPQKEPAMLYKSIVLELLQDQPDLYEQLRSTKRLLPALDTYAIDLKASHEESIQQLAQARPGSDSRQIASEALEIAVQNLQDLLHSASSKDETEHMALDGAMSYLLRHTPPA
jgi:hypothetical protein